MRRERITSIAVSLMLIPLAISIVFGLLSATVLVLLVVPCLYMILHDFGLTTLRGDDE